MNLTHDIILSTRSHSRVMPHMQRLLLMTYVVCAAGCGTQPAGISSGLPEIASVNANPAPDKPFTFDLTPEAAKRIRGAVDQHNPGCHVVISVDFDDKQFCTGYHYTVGFAATPSASEYILLTSNGVALAVSKEDAPYLSGTTIDFGRTQSGESGLVFHNPNEKISSLKSDLAGPPKP